jgi:hypothetical protein
VAAAFEAVQVPFLIGGSLASNLIHQTSDQKLDIFPALQPFHASEVERATKSSSNFRINS